MLTGVTSSGFEYKITDESIDDMDLVEALAEVDSGSKLAITKVLSLLFGEDQKKALYEHLREKYGRVPISAVESELMDVIKNSKDGKN